MKAEVLRLKHYKGYLVDLDGTMYKGNQVIEGAAEFIQSLNKHDIPYLFLTNNSSKTQVDVATHLNSMGIETTPDRVFTTSMAAAKYVKSKKANARCYVIGEDGLIDAIEKENMTITDQNCDFVVFGIDRNITYEKYAKACLAIRDGATFISTNSDIAIPTERGLLPGNGALTSVITTSTNQEPIFIGKPESIIMNEAMAVLGTRAEDTIMVGDNYQTDIQAGIQAGIDTLMVFTGVTPFDAYPSLRIKPTQYVHNLKEWIPFIK